MAHCRTLGLSDFALEYLEHHFWSITYDTD